MLRKGVVELPRIEILDWENRHKSLLHRLFGKMALYVKDVPPYAYHFESPKQANEFLQRIDGQARILTYKEKGKERAVLVGPIYLKAAGDLRKVQEEVMNRYGRLAGEIYTIIQKIEHDQILEGTCRLCPKFEIE